MQKFLVIILRIHVQFSTLSLLQLQLVDLKFNINS